MAQELAHLADLVVVMVAGNQRLQQAVFLAKVMPEAQQVLLRTLRRAAAAPVLLEGMPQAQPQVLEEMVSNLLFQVQLPITAAVAAVAAQVHRLALVVLVEVVTAEHLLAEVERMVLVAVAVAPLVTVVVRGTAVTAGRVWSLLVILPER